MATNKFPCLFIEPDAVALQILISMVIREGVMIADVGSWVGSSTMVSARAVLPYHGSVFAIDHWKGSPGIILELIAKENDVYSIFKKNMVDNGVWGIVHPLVMDSQTACRILSDNMFDLVFIDADHRYEQVKQDILSWMPKVRTEGILCGHDIYKPYSAFPNEIRNAIDNSLNQDAIAPKADICIHPGVTKALYDCFDDKYSIMPNSSIWFAKRYSKLDLERQ